MTAIMAINIGHNGSAAVVVDGELVYYTEEERLSRFKYDGNPFRAMIEVLQNVQIDHLIIGGTSNNLSTLPWTGEDAYTALVRKYNPNVQVSRMGHLHHLGHATGAFYNSGFETAVAVIVDGSGTYTEEQIGENNVTGGFETESIYHCSYPHNFEAVYKKYANGDTRYHFNGIQEFDNAVTITKAYEAVSNYLGFGYIEAGKTMGLAPYGEENSSIPDFFIDGRGNKNLLMPRYPAGAEIDEFRNGQLQRFEDPKEWHNDFSLCRQIDKDIAFKIQQETEDQVAKLIQKAIDITGETNVVLAGGYGLNCVANYKFVKRFPGINIYADPVSHDGGTAIGLAKYAWYNISKETTTRKLKSLYLGMNPRYDVLDNILPNFPDLKVIDTTPEDVAKLLVEGNIVSLFQGRAEAGPRALGNRSILFDPRRKDGKEFVNIVKKREWFRPFAGSVLKEHANEWFDMAGMEESPFMMYAVDVLTDKMDIIPAITHVDGTCRAQTVSEEDNKHYYDLINAFYKETNVPILFNTSFNLAGQPLVENIVDALLTIVNSDIKYLYLPEIGKIITKE